MDWHFNWNSYLVDVCIHCYPFVSVFNLPTKNEASNFPLLPLTTKIRRVCSTEVPTSLYRTEYQQTSDSIRFVFIRLKQLPRYTYVYLFVSVFNMPEIELYRSCSDQSPVQKIRKRSWYRCQRFVRPNYWHWRRKQIHTRFSRDPYLDKLDLVALEWRRWYTWSFQISQSTSKLD